MNAISTIQRSIAAFAAAAFFTLAGAVFATAVELGDATIDLWTDDDRVLVIDGDLGPNTTFNFKRMLNENPQVRTVLLNSGGGLVSTGLDVAQVIANRQLDTWVPKTAMCASACSVIYFSGLNRVADGQLGVHQIAMNIENNSEVQVTASDMIEAFNRYGTHPGVFAVMLRTPPDKMYFFTELEKLQYQIGRGSLTVPAFTAPIVLPPLLPPGELFGGDLPVLKGLNLPQ